MSSPQTRFVDARPSFSKSITLPYRANLNQVNQILVMEYDSNNPGNPPIESDNFLAAIDEVGTEHVKLHIVTISEDALEAGKDYKVDIILNDYDPDSATTTEITKYEDYHFYGYDVELLCFEKESIPVLTFQKLGGAAYYSNIHYYVLSEPLQAADGNVTVACSFLSDNLSNSICTEPQSVSVRQVDKLFLRVDTRLPDDFGNEDEDEPDARKSTGTFFQMHLSVLSQNSTRVAKANAIRIVFED